MRRVTIKVHIFDILAAMVFIGTKVTPSDIANHLYDDKWGDVDKYDILQAVNKTLSVELKKPQEDHYGIRNESNLYWLNYNVE